jgi:hypothetical protein
MIRSLELPSLPKVFNIPPSIQKYLKPMLMASVGLHVFALLAPLPTDQLDQKSHRPKTVRLVPRKTVRKIAKTIPKSPLPVKTLPKVRVVVASNKGLVIPGPPKKRVAKLATPPKGKPPTEKKQSERKQPEKPQSGRGSSQSKPPSPPPANKPPTPPSPPTGNGGMDDFLQSIVAGLSENTDVSPDQFSSPTDFFPNYKKPEPNAPLGFDIPDKLADGIEDSRLVKSKAPSQVYEELSASLSQSGYVPTPVADGYGGGLLYKIDKDKFTVYLNLVPIANGSGTVVVTWSTNPN